MTGVNVMSLSILWMVLVSGFPRLSKMLIRQGSFLIRMLPWGLL